MNFIHARMNLLKCIRKKKIISNSLTYPKQVSTDWGHCSDQHNVRQLKPSADSAGRRRSYGVHLLEGITATARN